MYCIQSIVLPFYNTKHIKLFTFYSIYIRIIKHRKILKKENLSYIILKSEMT